MFSMAQMGVVDFVGLSETTVERDLSAVYDTLNIRSRTEAVMVRRAGLVTGACECKHD